MGAVKDKLCEANLRPAVVADCVSLIDSEVASKKGVSGMMIKGGYKAFKALKPSIVQEAVDHLLEDFIEVIDTHYSLFVESGQSSGSSFESWAGQHDTRIANDMLGITDRMMQRSSGSPLAKIYKGMRKVAERNVAEAVPGVARIVDKHMK